MRVPWRTATVLGRTVSGASNANRVSLAGIEREHSFEADVMLPEVPHVVVVLEAFARPQLEIGELDLEWIVSEDHAARAVIAVLFAIDAKPMQVQVLPAHGDLDDGMQLTE